MSGWGDVIDDERYHQRYVPPHLRNNRGGDQRQVVSSNDAFSEHQQPFYDSNVYMSKNRPPWGPAGSFHHHHHHHHIQSTARDIGQFQHQPHFQQQQGQRGSGQSYRGGGGRFINNGRSGNNGGNVERPVKSNAWPVRNTAKANFDSDPFKKKDIEYENEFKNQESTVIDFKVNFKNVL